MKSKEKLQAKENWIFVSKDLLLANNYNCQCWKEIVN